ncbi:protein kinase [Nonomuraea sp. NPDC049309]|uniref:protein kinase domain-containing protein n=1 Tax=Nonomuraea sp. NPDC049309 TaxID=3364350 RepID=UPI00371716F7
MRPLTVTDPAIIGRYLLLGRLGTGGMGVVYLAEHPQGGLVALKTPHPVHLNDATLRARFAEEVAYSRRLVPFCTAAVIEDGTDRDRPYLVTEYIPGPALSQVVTAGGPLAPGLAHGVALGVAAALVAVHEAGLVHRDLKPANVLLSPDGPRVIDFGIARDVDVSAAHTQAGQIMGSPGWVAPERLTGGSALPASDVFAWGCLVAYAATGHHPFGGGGDDDVLTRRILFDPPRLDGVPVLLRPTVAAALAKDPAERPAAPDLLRALLTAGGLSAPWNLRQAVPVALARLWIPVPHPTTAGTGLATLGGGGPAGAEPTAAGTGLATLGGGGPAGAEPAAAGTGLTGGDSAGEGVAVAGLAPAPPTATADVDRSHASRRGRRARQTAHLGHAGFAALATVSIAALTVIVAAGGDKAGGEAGALPPADPPAVVETSGSAHSTIRPTASAGRGLPVVRPATTAPPPGTPTVIVTETMTKEPARTLAPPSRSTVRILRTPPRTFGPGGRDRGRGPGPRDEEPESCLGPGGERMRPGNRPIGRPVRRRACPVPPVSISGIPQEGPGESVEPSPTPSPAPAPGDPTPSDR